MIPLIPRGRPSALAHIFLILFLTTSALFLYPLRARSSHELLPKEATRPPKKLASWRRPPSPHRNKYPKATSSSPPPSCTFSNPLANLPFPLPRAPPLSSDSSDISLSLSPAPSGLLFYSPKSDITNSTTLDSEIHPILRLIDDSQRNFFDLLSNQSSTLQEARAAYSLANDGLEPFPGFSSWYTFASSNSVLFLDHYPHLTALLSPFRTLSSSERHARLLEAESLSPDEPRPKFFARIVCDGKGNIGWESLRYQTKETVERNITDYTVPQVGRWQKPEKRVAVLLDLLEGIKELLPAFSIVVNSLDEPVVLRPSAGLPEGKPHSSPLTSIDWSAHCSSVAPFEMNITSTIFSFVHRPQMLASPCLHPSLRASHGFYLENANPDNQLRTHTRLLPIWSSSSTGEHADFLLPPVGIEGKMPSHTLEEEADWKDLKDEVFWRGSSTGMTNVHRPDPSSSASSSASPSASPLPLSSATFYESHRIRLHRFFNPSPPSPSSSTTSPSTVEDENENFVAGSTELLTVDELGRPAVEEVEKKEVKGWFNVSLASSLFWRWFSFWPETGQQCSWMDGSCSDLKQAVAFAAKEPSSKADEYRYVLDVDGNGWSARFPFLLAGKSLVLKSTAFTEWNTDLHFPWFAYAPFQNSLVDLESIVAFFKGPPSLPTSSTSDDDDDKIDRPPIDMTYSSIAEAMIQNGRCLERHTWRKVDMQVYLLRSLMEYARLFSPPPSSAP